MLTAGVTTRAGAAASTVTVAFRVVVPAPVSVFVKLIVLGYVPADSEFGPLLVWKLIVVPVVPTLPVRGEHSSQFGIPVTEKLAVP